jgi:hypothetical protein
MDDEDAPMSPAMFIRMLEDLIKEARERALSVEAIAAALDDTAAALIAQRH